MVKELSQTHQRQITFANATEIPAKSRIKGQGSCEVVPLFQFLQFLNEHTPVWNVVLGCEWVGNVCPSLESYTRPNSPTVPQKSPSFRVSESDRTLPKGSSLLKVAGFAILAALLTRNQKALRML